MRARLLLAASALTVALPLSAGDAGGTASRQILAAVDVTVGGGAVWVSQVDSRRVFRIDPRTNRVSATIDLSLPESEEQYPPGPFGIAAAASGVWVAFSSKV